MQNEHIWALLLIAIVSVMILGNRKVRLFSLIKEQLCVFTNDKTKRRSMWDYICFLLLPILAALILVCRLEFTIDANLANLLTTVFSVVFTVLFGFAAIMISKIESQNKIERQVAEETFVSIVSSTILSLVAAVASIVLTQVETALYIQILSAFIIALSLVIVMLILMITKRTFLLYVDNRK